MRSSSGAAGGARASFVLKILKRFFFLRSHERFSSVRRKFRGRCSCACRAHWLLQACSPTNDTRGIKRISYISVSINMWSFRDDEINTIYGLVNYELNYIYFLTIVSHGLTFVRTSKYDITSESGMIEYIYHQFFRVWNEHVQQLYLLFKICLY